MLKRVVVPGLLGGITLMIWTFIANGMFGLSARLRMQRLADESAVHQILKEHVVAAGGYTVNPEPLPGVGYPGGEPVFQVLYSGFGHEAAGRMLFIDAGVAFASSLLVALLLSLASVRVLSRFAGRAAFVAMVGLLLALYGELTRYGIGGLPVGSALLLSVNTLVMWTLAGMVMARSMPAAANNTST